MMLAVGVIHVIAATYYTYNGYSYMTLNDDYISICGWDNSSETLTIPAQLSGSYVKEIADQGFRDNTYITSVSFNRAIYMTRIGRQAFQGCSGLSGTVSLPNRITDIGYNAFQDCSMITSVEYYASTATIPSQCFYNCSSLNHVVITDGVTSIGKLAFANCPQLSYVRIPYNVTSINLTSFNNCPNLVIYCYTDSYAHQFAVEKGIDYVLIDAPVPTEPPTEEPTDAPTDPATEVPTDAPTDPATEKPTVAPGTYTFILGDADGDGVVTIIDATKIQRVLVDLDRDEDGMISLRGIVDDEDILNILHATKIQRYLADFDVDEPIGEEITRVIS